MKTLLERVRSTRPLIHNITNYVTVNDVANAILAIGGSPIMADEIDEAEEITSICKGLNINIGTLNSRTICAMFAAGKKAFSLGHKIVLDPVGAGASILRTKTALDLLGQIHFDVVRGNISEIKTLFNGSGITKGVDADISESITESNLSEMISFVKNFAKKLNCVIAVTGKIDLVSDAEKTFVIRNGRAEMGGITGTGCQLSGIVAAFISANPNEVLEAAASAVCTMGVCGEIAWESMREGEGNATYRNKIIDAICNLTGEQLERKAKYEIR